MGRLEQDDIRRMFMSLGSGTWTVVYDSWHDEEGNGAIHCAFASPEVRNKAVSSPDWDLTIGDHRPGFSVHHDESGESKTVYESGFERKGVEPLVLLRSFYGAVPDTIEIVEQFRLFHNLFWDELTSQFIQPHDDGTSSVAVKIQGDRVEVRTKLLRQYQAARQLDLLLFIDSAVFGSDEENLPPTETWSEELLSASRHAANERFSRGRRKFSFYRATRVLPPPPMERSGIWPFEDDEDDHYPEFIVGTDPDGVEIEYTCNPEVLANYFGANPRCTALLDASAFSPRRTPEIL